MLNAIPIVGWFLDFGFKASMAIPFWIVWTVCGVGERFFYFLPKVYLSIGFWNCVGLFIAIGILKCVLVPTFSHNTTSSESKS